MAIFIDIYDSNFSLFFDSYNMSNLTKLKFAALDVNGKNYMSSFHASNITLQQQYRLQKFKRYFELNSFLLVAE